jgi:hypothetical protein
MVAAHLNPVRYAPLASCEQRLLRNNQVITGVWSHAGATAGGTRVEWADGADLRFFFAADEGWHWSSTSAMMFRRPVLTAIRPNFSIGHHGDLDAYLAPGAHMLGGSMFLRSPLVYRGLHSANDWLREDTWGQFQTSKAPCRGRERRAQVRAAIIANGYGNDLTRASVKKRKLHHRLRRSILKRWNRFVLRK